MNICQLRTLSALMLAIGFSRAAEVKFTPPVPLAPEVLAAPDADAAWRIVTAKNQLSPAERAALPPSEQAAARTAAFHRHNLQAMSFQAAFFQKYPTDPRRWHFVLAMRSTTRMVAHEDGTVREGVDVAGWSAAAWADWQKQLAVLLLAGIDAPDTPAETRLAFEITQPGGLRDRFDAIDKALHDHQPADLVALRTELWRYAAKYPDQQALGSWIKGYMNFRGLAGATADELRTEWQTLATDPHEGIRAAAQDELKKMESFSRPLGIAFTAVDGRTVDLKELRGKVVLVDFWATWCGPCVAELPNVKKVYAAYHDKGFEVVGIALENGKLLPQDTAEQAAEKMTKAKKVLMDFTAKNEMPWPQYFDGKYWKNDISTKYAINSIPAMFLIDQAGIVVSTNARGEGLEREVKRLLKF